MSLTINPGDGAELTSAELKPVRGPHLLLFENR
jgi:hypothetical protein